MVQHPVLWYWTVGVIMTPIITVWSYKNEQLITSMVLLRMAKPSATSMAKVVQLAMALSRIVQKLTICGNY